jgi:hypothetical protein
MKTKFALMLVFAGLVFCGNVRAQIPVVGIKPNASLTSAQATTTSTINFNTRLSGSKITGLGLYRYGSSTFTEQLNSIVTLTDGTSTQTGKFNLLTGYAGAGSQIGITWDGGVSTGVLESDKSYSLVLSSLTNLGEFNSIGTTAYEVQPGISDFWSSPTRGADSNAAISLYYDPASVPEPGTLILTGSALVAGAVGAYLKRRRKTLQQEAA